MLLRSQGGRRCGRRVKWVVTWRCAVCPNSWLNALSFCVDPLTPLSIFEITDVVRNETHLTFYINDGVVFYGNTKRYPQGND